MNIITKIAINALAVLCALPFGASAQRALTPPQVLVVPDIIYCRNHNFTQTFAGQGGVTEIIPDYERAINEDQTLHSVLTQVEQLITDRNSDIVIIDLNQAIANAKADAMMSNANGGDTSESIEEAIIRNSNADVIVKVQYDLLNNGPEYQVAYTIKGVDPFTNRTFAPIEGLGRPSTSANPVVLLRDAVYGDMDNFLTKLMAFYSSMSERGRMVAFDIKTTDESPVNLNTRVGDITVREAIEDFLFDNSVNGGGLENVRAGSTFMQYNGIYIPLTYTARGRQRRQGAKDIAQRLVNHLEQNYDIRADYFVSGVGKVNIYLK